MIARVRSMVERKVGGGEVIFWHDVVGWLNRERKDRGMAFEKWLVTSVDTDDWIITLLAMSTAREK
ncbi:unnamed protein product [Pylaiella littoralis]